MGRRFPVALGAVLVAFTASAATADAAIFQVTRQDDPAPGTCDPGDCSLREAVTAANGSSGQDTIILPGGTYVLSLGQLPTVTDPLTIAGAGASTTRITGGTQAGPSIVLRAGAIAASGVDLVLERLTVAGNTVTVDNVAADAITIGAGGVAVTSGSLTLIDSAVRGNSDLARNTVGAGGVTVSGAPLVLVNSSVADNVLSGGGTVVAGGLTVDDGTADVSSSTISGNTAPISRSSTIATGGVATTASTLMVTNTTVSNNTAGAGSTATIRAGGLFTDGGDLIVTHATLAGNSAQGSGANAGNLGFDASGTHTLRNSVVANGSSPSGANCNAAFTSQGGNVESTNTCGLNPVLGDKPNTDPQLKALADNGASVQTQALAATSPAIDAASTANCTATDERGISRPRGPACDSGAFEFDHAPINTAGPAISGDARVGRTLSCSNGSWSDDVSLSFAWLRNGTPIATGPTLTLRQADQGAAIQCQVTASNTIGSTVAASAPVVPGPQFTAARNTQRPTIAGPLRRALTVGCDPGAWTESPSFTFAWLRDGVAIPGAAGPLYTLDAADVGHALQCQVTARVGDTATVAETAPGVVAGACIVPALKGATLASARRQLAAGGCGTGNVTKRATRKVKAGRVVKTSPAAGADAAQGTKVNVVLAKKPKPKRKRRR